MSFKQPVIFGEVLYDCFEQDGSRILGGAPFNVAWHLQGFNAQPLFISRLGDDLSGHEIATTMQQWGMNTDGLQWDSQFPTGEVSISLQDGQPTFKILKNQAYDYINTESIPPLNPSLLYHGSLGVREATSAQALNALLTQYQPAVFLDVNLRPPWWKKEQILALIQHTRWLKINDDELNTLVDEPHTLEEKAQILLSQNAMDLVIVTQGKEGAMTLDKQGQTHRIKPVNTTQVVDTVGAGDAFASVCILGLIHQWPAPLMLERAQEFASLIVGQRGATLHDANIYKKLIAKWNP